MTESLYQQPQDFLQDKVNDGLDSPRGSIGSDNDEEEKVKDLQPKDKLNFSLQLNNQMVFHHRRVHAMDIHFNCKGYLIYLTQNNQRVIVTDPKYTKITVLELATAKKLHQFQLIYQRSFVCDDKIFVVDSDGVLKVINCENSKEINFNIQDSKFTKIYNQIVQFFNFNCRALGVLYKDEKTSKVRLKFFSLSQNPQGNSLPMISNFEELFESVMNKDFEMKVLGTTILIHSLKYIFIGTYSYSKSQIQFNIVQQFKTKTFFVQPTLDKNFLHINIKVDLSVHLFFHVKTHQFSQIVTTSDDAPTMQIKQETIMNVRAYTHIEIMRKQPFFKIVSMQNTGCQDNFLMFSSTFFSGNFLVQSNIQPQIYEEWLKVYNK